MSTTLITSGKRKQIVRLLEDGLDKVELDDSRAQRLIEHGDKLQEGLKELLERLSLSNRFADEEVESRYVYPAGFKAKGIAEQVSRLCELFPGIGTANEKLADQPLPSGAEGYFVIPRWKKIAPTYNEAVEKVLALIEKTRNGKFYNYRAGELGPQYLRQHSRTVKLMQKVGEQQKNHDMLVIPAQFGFRHRGRSVRRAREVFTANECGLGAFAIGIMLLTHPKRLQHLNNLWIDCAGDEFAPGAGGEFSGTPFFMFSDGKVRFDSSVVDVANKHYGSSSAVPPQ